MLNYDAAHNRYVGPDCSIDAEEVVTAVQGLVAAGMSVQHAVMLLLDEASWRPGVETLAYQAVAQAAVAAAERLLQEARR